LFDKKSLPSSLITLNSPRRISLSEGKYLSSNFTLSNSLNYDNANETINHFNYTGIICSSSSQTIFLNNYASILSYYETVRDSSECNESIIQLSLIDFDPSRNSILLNGKINSKCLILFILKLAKSISFYYLPGFI